MPHTISPNSVTSISWNVNGHSNRYSALTMLVYDFVLTFEDERNFFWTQRLSWAGALFIWNRYSSLILVLLSCIVYSKHHPSDSVYAPTSLYASHVFTLYVGWIWFNIEGWLGLSSAWSTELILQLRIYALYERSFPIATTLGISFILQALGVIGILAAMTHDMSAVALQTGPLYHCAAPNIPSWVPTLWAFILAFESILFGLAISKGYQRLRYQHHSAPSSTWRGTHLHMPDFGRSLYDILVRDSAMYYIAVLLIYLINMILWIVQPEQFLDIMTPFAIAIPSVFCTRLMINIRSSHHGNLNAPVDSPSNIELDILIPTTAPSHPRLNPDDTVNGPSHCETHASSSVPP